MPTPLTIVARVRCLEERLATLENKVEALSEDVEEIIPLIDKTLANSSKVLAAWKSHDQKFFYKEEDR